MSCSLPHPLRGWPAVLLALAAVGSTPAPAAAACGDYVVIRGADGQPAPHAAGDTPDPAAPVPCNGPACSGSPAREPFAPAAPPAGTGPKDGVTAGGVEPPAARGRRFPVPTSEHGPRRVAASVFHPPRAA